MAHDEIKKAQSESRGSNKSQAAEEFEASVGVPLPWHRLWAEVLTGRIPGTNFATALGDTLSASTKMLRVYREDPETSNEITLVWLDALLEADGDKASSAAVLTQWITSQTRPLFIPTLTRLARVTARTGSLAAQALDFAGRLLEILDKEREDAESVAASYVDLARALLSLSRAEAGAYFDAAVTVASKFGDEVPDRWSAILQLADRAGNRTTPAPDVAYKLARSAELTHRYVRDSYFDWEATVSAIAGICPSSSVAILSRWRDRDFGWTEKLLPITVDALLRSTSLDPRTAVALTCFRAKWDKPQLLKAALPAFADRAEKERAAAFLYRYMRLAGESASVWQALKDITASESVALDGVDELIAFSAGVERVIKQADEPVAAYEAAQRDRADWERVFSGTDLSRANDISLAYRRYRDTGPPSCRKSFFEEATRRVPPGREPEFVTALADIPELDLYDLRDILQVIPTAWGSRPSVKSAFANTLKNFCRRFCREIEVDRHYEVFPFKAACELSGIEQGEFVEVVLSALGQTPELFGARRLFSLVGLLASELSNLESAEALSFGLGLFESVLEGTDGDGPWSASLEPPADVEQAVAGYIWAALASPKATVRWEAAHVVRGLCTTHREAALAHLLAFARQGAGGPFADARLHFYGLHARQWLLIALARAAKEYPLTVLRHEQFLIGMALNGPPHVLMREFASS